MQRTCSHGCFELGGITDKDIRRVRDSRKRVIHRNVLYIVSCGSFSMLISSDNFSSSVVSALKKNRCNNSEGPEVFTTIVELWYLFSAIWSIGGALDAASRKLFDVWLREQDSRFPPSNTVYDYWVDPVRKGWAPWDEKITSTIER